MLVGRPIGVLYRSDGDHKIVALRADAGTAYPATSEVVELPELQAQLVQWLTDYRADVQATGWGDAAAARRLILELSGGLGGRACLSPGWYLLAAYSLTRITQVSDRMSCQVRRWLPSAQR